MIRHNKIKTIIFFIILSLSPFIRVHDSNAVESDLKSINKIPEVIDFDDVVKPNTSDKGDLKLSQLRVAVAAIISPEYTYKYYVDLLKLIGKNMGRSISFVQKKTYSEVNEMLKQGELDLAVLSCL